LHRLAAADQRQAFARLFARRAFPAPRVRRLARGTDKLVEIAKSGTDINLRKQAIIALTRKNDPRSAQLFQDILDGKRP